LNFVSNSSSSSFVVIGNSFPDPDWYKKNFKDCVFDGSEQRGCTEFGWGPDVLKDADSRINFAYIQAQMIYNDENFTETTAQMFNSVFKQIYDYNMLYEEYFAPQEEEKDTLEIDVPELEEVPNVSEVA
jgi:hypothetical protein